jgi:hypothetical protein
VSAGWQVTAFRRRRGWPVPWSGDPFQAVRRDEVLVGQVHSLSAGGLRNPMMKIQMNEFDDLLVLQVEGRLAGAFVPELENCWRAARAGTPGRKVSVDLKSVTCIDRAGRCLLQLMHSEGVGFLRAGLAVQDILEQITGQAECKQ